MKIRYNDYFIAGVVDTADKHLFANIPRIFEKIRNDPNGILRGLGWTDLWKNLKLRISSQSPFKHFRFVISKTIFPAAIYCTEVGKQTFF